MIYAPIALFTYNRADHTQKAVESLLKNEEAKVQELADDFHSRIIVALNRSDLVTDAEELEKTVLSAFPDSDMAVEYRALASAVMEECSAC